MPLIVGSLGTHRISRPLQLAAGRTASYFDNTPFYNGATTSAEILQQLRYALGYMEIPRALAPLLTNYRELTPNLTFELPHDLIFVEISGRRVLSLDGIVLQAGSVGYFFADRASLADALTRFWGPGSLENRMRFLAQDPAFEDASPDERRLLTEARTDLATDDDILVDIRRMHALVGDRLVLVATAIDETAPEPVRKARADIVTALQIAGGQLGLPVFDPSGPLNDFRSEHGFGTSSADSHLLNAAFESYLGGVLARDFLGPLRRVESRSNEQQAAIAPSSTGAGGVLDAVRRRLLPRRLIGGGPTRHEPAAAQQPAAPEESVWDAAQRESRKAAWFGEWEGVASWARRVLDQIAGDRVFCERAATAFWYVGDAGTALDLWKSRDFDQIAPLRMIEAAELAFQAGEPGVGADWCRTAAATGALAALAAIRMLDAHGRHDLVAPLIDMISAEPGALASLVNQLPSTGALRTFVVEYGLTSGRLDPELPAAKSVIQQWLNQLSVEFREGNLAAVRAIAGRFDAFDPGHPARQSARQILVRALIGRMRDADGPRGAEEAEASAREILALEAGHVEAVMALTRILDQRGDRPGAASLLDGLSHAHPQAVAVQFAVINQRLAWGDISAATAAFRRSLEASAGDDMLNELRKRLGARIEREERQARQANDHARLEEVRRCLADIRMTEAPREIAGFRQVGT